MSINSRGVNQGIFGAAFKLSKSGLVESQDKTPFEDQLQWMQENLYTPEIFECEQNKKGVCWFKISQVDLIQRVRALIPIVEKCGLEVQTLSSDAPGLVIYEDSQQIVAILSVRYRDGGTGLIDLLNSFITSMTSLQIAGLLDCCASYRLVLMPY